MMGSFVDRLASELELEREAVLHLVDTFFNASWEDVRLLEGALACGDARGLSRHAHDIKGAAAGLDFEASRHAAEDLEMAARDGRLSEAPSLLAALRLALESLQRERDLDAGIGSGA
jgi:HPt (histidine-containing phosphotransfer) domain-containing protein